MVVTTAGALRLLPKIERGLGTERARLGTFRGFAKRLSFFYSKRAPIPAKTEVLHETLKTVLPIVILKFLISTPTLFYLYNNLS